MARPHTRTQNRSQNRSSDEICIAIRLLRYAKPETGTERILSQVEVDNSCTITSKDLRWHMNIIETEGEQSDEDPAAASKAEK